MERALQGQQESIFASQTSSRSAGFLQNLLGRRVLQTLAEVKDGEVCVWNKRKQREEEEEMLQVSNELQEDSAILALLKACANQKDLHKGSRIHADILRRRLLEKSIYIGNSLVNLYAKCGALAKAQQVFDDELPVRDVVSWNTLIGGYARNGHGGKALDCYEEMQHKGFSPNAATFSCILKACGSLRAASKGEQIHAEIVRDGLLGKDLFLGTALVDMYAKCGALEKAQEVFDELQIRNVVSWNALITGYTHHGQGEKALNCFERMQHEGLSPSRVTFICILKACGSIGAVEKGKELHAEIVREGLLEKSILLGNALVDMYAKCGELEKAQEVFDELRVRDVVTWNALVAGYAQHRQGEEAFNCLERMQRGGFSPDAVTFVCILKACGKAGAADKGEEIHAEVVRGGFLQEHALVGTALVDMYAKCGALEKAQKLFDELPVRDIVSWNTLIAGYAQHKHGEEALNCFNRMQREGHSPNAVTLLCALKACRSIGEVDKAKEIHATIVREGFLETNRSVGTALVDMYAKCGALEKAREVFDDLPVQNVVTWTALISGYTQKGHGEAALDCFDRMQHEGISPNAPTFVSILKACGITGAIDRGKEIHDAVVRERLLGKDMLVGNALVDMYAKCGALDKAQEVFDGLPVLDVISWNTLIAGYALHGHVEEALNYFDWMQEKGASPNAVTFLLVLNACSHAGLLGKGQMYFETMSTGYGVNPDLEHYTSMVDLFSRAGHFAKAIALIRKMQTCDYLPIWTALLGACLNWGNVKLGRFAFEHAVKLDEQDPGAYICMSNIYAAASMQEDADEIEALRVKNTAWEYSLSTARNLS